MARRKKISKPYRVFVSHATADKFLAVTLCEKLEAVGISTFRDDRDIDGGDDIPEKIRGEIKRAQELIVLLTPNSANRAWGLGVLGGDVGGQFEEPLEPSEMGMAEVDDFVPGIAIGDDAADGNGDESMFGATGDAWVVEGEKKFLMVGRGVEVAKGIYGAGVKAGEF